ncbi:nucleoside-diphosphate kinase [Vibrio coralliirubri]|uniref:nucleoside-diphosphate kinase n=1 Tax=Vibrio coralliirubri TaxID=1516159 RepID=UPI0022833D10|nr:nucleoside-diphosphate kinase [Vibrio coralliirubri]MCY9861189.1 nucleoside-diphosphate kinase [Vibrio coralliirubri]
MKEKTLGLIKPDAVKRGIIGEILAVIESERFEIVGLKMMRFERTEAEAFYAEHQGKPFFEELIDYMTSGKVVAFVLERENAITRYRDLMGTTDPMQAQEGTLRKLFALSKNENSVHGSDSSAASDREIALIFG